MHNTFQNMKKRWELTAIIFSLLPLISADQFDFSNAQSQVTRVIDSMLGIASPFFQTIIGDYSTSQFFFEKILLLILLLVISKNILERTPIGENNSKVSFIVAAIISILAIRFMNQNQFIESILIQYGTLGIAITTILPMVIFFYFVHNTNVRTFGRKMFWTIYAIILGAIWISKSSNIPQIANWIYGLTFLAAIIFIFLDKSIHSYFGLSHLGVFMAKSNKEAIWRAKERIQKLNERYNNGIISHWEWSRGIKEEENRIKEFSKGT